jgi:hypothetical protein
VVASAALLLLAAPNWGGSEVWAWITPPFNARYVGVIYLAALVPLVILAVSGRWSPGRLVYLFPARQLGGFPVATARLAGAGAADPRARRADGARDRARRATGSRC